MSTQDFDGTPFVAGTVTGQRTWKVDKLGRLTGVSHAEVWKPGVNTGICRAGSVGSYSAAIAQLVGTMGVSSARRFMAGGYVPSATTEAAVSVKKSDTDESKHRVGQVACTCGYYAYFDRGANVYHESGQVKGVIEGSGVVTVGTRGFRAEHAKIVALVAPKRDGRPLDRLSRAVKPAGWGCWMGGIFLALGSITGATIGVSSGYPYWAALYLAAALGTLTAYLGFRSIDVPPARSLDRFDLARRNYPDVKVYRSMRAAVAAHPLTEPPTPPVPSPETDDDFWSRSAS